MDGDVKFNYVEMTLAIKKYELDCAWFCPSSKIHQLSTGQAEQMIRSRLDQIARKRQSKKKNEKKNYGF